MNCDGTVRLEPRLDRAVVAAASLFLKQSEIVLPPKKLVHSGLFRVYEFLTGRLESRDPAAQEGRILGRWGDAGWGHMVADGKHRERFDLELARAAAEMVRNRWSPQPPPEWVTCVPSRTRPHLVTDTQTILLLTGHFQEGDLRSAQPLGPSEWARFALCLKQQGLRPSSPLEQQTENLPDLIDKAGIPAERIQALLHRSVALALSLEKWNRVGIWVVSRASAAYPQQLKQRLGVKAPLILYGCGNEDLLDGGGLAIVGSRNAGEADLDLAAELSRAAARERIAVVSGGARGVDDTSMQAALDAGGAVIGVLSDSLQRSALSSRYRSALREGRVVLVSTVAPEARFNVGNAMARNKYIYCLANAAVVIHSGKTGGTWHGALEAVRH